MLSFVYESTVFLGCSYGFYYLFLKGSRSFAFIRYFLLVSLLSALIIPFIEIDVGRNLPLVGSVVEGKYYTLLPVNGEVTLVNTRSAFTQRSVLLLAYFTGFGLMLLRFLMNLLRLARKAKKGNTLIEKYGRIVLTEEQGLPYSFFRNIYLSRLIYEREEEVEKLLLHESAHCRQYHSLDILFAELLKVILWFNPFLWLIANAIRLNHEYMADEKVLETQSKNAYQLLLINMELANQSSGLASDFNYSLTHKRLAMMNNKDWGKNGVLRKLSAISLFLFLTAILTFCEADKKSEFDPIQTMEFYPNDWWAPILKRHEITPLAYNNFEYIFEMGSTNSIDARKIRKTKI